MTNTPSQELKACPFCGGRARKELGKRKTCQLHGDPYQDTIIRCPLNNCVRMEGAEAVVIAKWNSRPTPAIVEGLKRWEYEYEMGNLTKALEGFEREHESDPKKVRILMGRYAMALASAKNVIDSLTPRPTPVSLEGLRDHLLAFVNYLNGNANDDLIYGEQVDTYLYELKNGKGKPFVFFDILTPHPNTPEPSGEEEAVRVGVIYSQYFKPILNAIYAKRSCFSDFSEVKVANKLANAVIDVLAELNYPVSPPKTEGGYKCEGCGCDTDMIQPYCHQCEHESIVKNEVREAVKERDDTLISVFGIPNGIFPKRKGRVGQRRTVRL
jgi:hypothetical protein